MKSSREITRLESISRSPILNNFKETISGIKFIRAFGKTDRFIEKNQEIIDVNTRINYTSFGCEGWMNLYLELLASLFVITMYFIAIIFREKISPGIIGLCVSYLLPISDFINQIIKNLTYLENQMVSVERVKSYTEIPSENSLSVPKDIEYPNWPITPTIKFNKVYLKYRPNTSIILKELSFEIPPGVRVGIAGRTGSGKSSIFLALLRIVELDKGLITIDDINIASLGLQKIRQSITLIPQDPLVFTGTLKENLDPLDQFTEKELKKVIDDAKLQLGLDHELKNSGKNISIGERQLLSLCRALLINKKIILFDEATAGTDPETDLRIQNIIKSKFVGCTILTIAHRLDTIKNSDLMLLIEDGKVLEFDSPQNLLSYDSKFKSFAQGLK